MSIVHASEIIERNKRAFELWQEWFTKEGDPTYASESGGDIYCFFCGAWVEHDDHEPDCIYIRAKALVGKDDT